MANTTILALQGLTCMHCVSSVKKVLDARPDVESAVVTLEFAKITGDADPQSLISAIEDAGYEAQVAAHPGTILQLSGLNCMKCAAKTQSALEGVEGVAAAVVDTKEAKIYGSADIQMLISAVEAAGFQAVVAGENQHPKTEPLTPVTSSDETVSAAHCDITATPENTPR